MKPLIPGGNFINGSNIETFAPEDLSSDAKLMAQSVERFMREAVLPSADRLQTQEEGLMQSLLSKAAELGLMGTLTPEKYGGLHLPKTTEALLVEKIAIEPSFSTTHNVHTSVAQLPIILFGTEEQQLKWLPKMASGELIGAYALSEADAGSDALGAKAKAVFDSSTNIYVLNGAKMWITNAAFADVFIVFAKVEGERFTAFIVERNSAGVSFGAEEHKMGLKGSSTRRLLLDDVRVPANCRLGEEGDGGKVALFALNIGRFKIAASALGASKELLSIAAKYAAQRVQFGKPISQFGLIKQKLAEMAARIFAAESALYRTAGLLDGALGIAENQLELRSASAEYAIECAICKVLCTQTLAFVSDEALQIHGGYGFSEEFPVARHYRDARINRIYEGTNEINRINIAELMLKAIDRKKIVINTTQAELKNGVWEIIPACALYSLIWVYNKFGIKVEQKVLGFLSDLLIHSYVVQSMSSRLNKMTSGQQMVPLLALKRSFFESHRSGIELFGMHGKFDSPYNNLLGSYNSWPDIDAICEVILEHEGYVV